MAVTLYYVVYPSGGTDPTNDATGRAHIVAGEDGAGSTTDTHAGNNDITSWSAGSYTITPDASGLTAGASYKAAAFATDGSSPSSVLVWSLWTQDSTVTSDLSGSYAVRAEVSSDLAGSYAVRAPVSSDLSASYAIREAVAADLSGSYAVRSEVSSDLAGSYTVDSSLTAVTSDLACSYSVQAPVTSDLAGAYSVRAAISSDLAGSYGVREPVSVDLTGLYSVLQAVQSDLAGSYGVAGSVTSDLACSYTVQTLGGASAADVWSYVMSNGKTAEENVVEIHAMLTALTPSAIAQAVLDATV